ncbi:MAG TPA: isochorismatase family protein [Thermoanaerobaculia bacterium]|mgnify:CR=1 FL=1|nr:isochorismatase family protein [Thermoanaerobaculia bacterium]HUM29606.1 isochorismatase family protein [Thermoanaerobaculia bacterium]HXK67257.1 isochorismatase family protein [Thermoanaerobaculia bacterium]
MAEQPFHLTENEIDSWCSFHQSEKIPFSPDQSALILIDLQRYFTDSEAPAYLPASGAAMDRLLPLLKTFMEKKRPVIFTRHVDRPDSGNLLLSWWQGRIEEDSPWSSLDERLTPFLQDSKIIKKEHYDAFRETDLETHLRILDVRQVVIGGVMTHLCCETTARSAFMRAFPVFFLVDGTATADRSFHLSSLTNLRHGFATLLRVSHVIQAL